MKFFRLVTTIAVLSTILSCVSSKDDDFFNTDPYLYKDYIQSFTSGMIPAKSDFRIVFAFDKSEWQPNDVLDQNLFQVQPKVPGKVVALSSNTIAFLPDNPLNQDTEYRVTFKLGDIIKTPKGLETFRFTLKTIAQDFIVNTHDLQSYDKEWQYLNASITTSDETSWEQIEKILTVTQDKNKLKLKKSSVGSSTTHYQFTIDSIQRFEEDSAIEIAWDGKPLGIKQKGTQVYTISGKNNFKIINVEVQDAERQTLLINFSDPVKKGQNLNGLVAIESVSDLRFSIQGNILKVFFDDLLKGDLLVEVFQGIQSEDGYKMKNTYAEKISFEQLKPQVRFLKSGTILPSSNHLKINIEVANLRALDVKVYKIFQNNILQFLQDNQLGGKYGLKKVALPVATETITFSESNIKNSGKWTPHAIDISKIINAEPGAIYRVEFSFKQSYSLYKCDHQLVETEETPEVTYYDEYNDYYYYDNYNWRDRDDPCTPSYYYNKTVGANLLASDLGVVVKKGTQNQYYFAVSNIVTTTAIQGAKVVLYNFQQQKIGEVSTKEHGEATIETAEQAYFAVVTHNNQTTYVKLDDGLALSVSNFDVSGQRLQKGLKGFVYTERGVWRPGDTLFVGFMLNDVNNKIAPEHPIQLKLNDPNGKLMFQATQKSNLLQHYVFKVPTNADDPTGSWEAIVSVGGAKFYKSIKIETIKPNRLKIKYTLDSDIIKSNTSNKAKAQVTWLHGAVAKDLKIEVLGKMFAQKTNFKGYSNFIFDDLTRKFEADETSLFQGKIDGTGQVAFDINPKISEAPGMLKASLLTKVYENGGDFSTDVMTATVSPYDHYVGIKSPEPNKYGMLETQKNNRFDIVSLNQLGQAVSLSDVEVQVYKIQWRWWWDASQDNISTFFANHATTPFKKYKVKTDKNGKASIQFAVTDDEWGRYLIRVEDKKGGHAAATTVVIDWPYWSGKTKNTDASHAAMLVFSTDKKAYHTNDKAIVSFPSSAGGRALVSIENGSKVLKTFWTQTATGETKLEIPITADMAPNVYINITLLQPHANSVNDSPIRMYGIVPIEVKDKNTILEPQLQMVDVLRPEQKTTIKVSEKSGKPMTYTIAIVDEGLLDLTRFKTPNAWHSFYAKEALGIKTWDIYDEVIGAYGGKVNQILTIGGDEDLGGANAKKADRFKPVVMHLGPFTLGKDKSNDHTINIPKYVGAVRTMVVAGDVNQQAYGSTEKSTPVRNPLMVLASFPRKVSPGEQVTLPVTVFAMESKVKQVNLQLKTKKGIILKSSATQSLSFAEPDEKMAYFDLEIDNFEGVSSIEVVATSGNEKASYSIDFDITNPNPITHEFQDFLLEPNVSQTVDLNAFGVQGTNKAVLEISAFPTLDFNRRLNYLITYPHGCLEQTTSAVFPQLYLGDITTLKSHQKTEIQKNIKAGIQKLGGYQLPNGGFVYWPGQSSAEDWSTSYVGHFLIEAEKKGYVLPLQFKTKWVAYQQRSAKQWRYNTTAKNDIAQAYRLYTLALSGNTDMASMNRLRETIGISNEAKLRLAAAYALAGQKSIGQTILNQTGVEVAQNSNYYFGSADRNRAMILETLLLLDEKKKAFEMATSIAKSLASDQWMSTQTTAYCLYAMSRFAKFNTAEGIAVSLNVKGKTQMLKDDKSVLSHPIDFTSAHQQFTLHHTQNNTLYVRVLQSGVLPVGQEKIVQSKLTANVVFKSRNGKPLDVSKVTQGTSFYAEITIANTSQEKVENIALTQILPSGFEIVNARYTDFGGESSNKADYIDIRDDRTNFYFPLQSQERRTFKVVLNASYLGKYYLPGLQVEAMYDYTYAVRSKGQWIEITRE